MSDRWVAKAHGRSLSAWAKSPKPKPVNETGVNALLAHVAMTQQAILPTLRVSGCETTAAASEGPHEP
jgi:hypothetical protein